MDHSRWRKKIGMIDDHNECEWVNVSSGTGSPGLSPDKIQRAVKRLYVCVLLPFLGSAFLYFRHCLSIFDTFLDTGVDFLMKVGFIHVSKAPGSGVWLKCRAAIITVM